MQSMGPSKWGATQAEIKLSTCSHPGMGVGAPASLLVLAQQLQALVQQFSVEGVQKQINKLFDCQVIPYIYVCA